jgi:hypothetical protein
MSRVGANPGHELDRIHLPQVDGGIRDRRRTGIQKISTGTRTHHRQSQPNARKPIETDVATETVGGELLPRALETVKPVGRLVTLRRRPLRSTPVLSSPACRLCIRACTSDGLSAPHYRPFALVTFNGRDFSLP